MSAGRELVGGDGWRRLPGRHWPSPHVLFEARRGEDEDQADAVLADVLEAHPRLRGKEDHASCMDVVFLVVQGDVRRASLDQQDLVLLQVFMAGSKTPPPERFSAGP